MFLFEKAKAELVLSWMRPSYLSGFQNDFSVTEIIHEWIMFVFVVFSPLQTQGLACQCSLKSSIQGSSR